MPNLPLKPCAQSGCPALTKTGRCPAHQRTVRPVRPIDKRGAYAYRVGGPGGKWKALRERILRNQPFCICGKRSVEVDHIQARRNGGTDHESNLRAMCHSCHSQKTARSDGAFGRKRW